MEWWKNGVWSGAVSIHPYGLASLRTDNELTSFRLLRFARNPSGSWNNGTIDFIKLFELVKGNKGKIKTILPQAGIQIDLQILFQIILT